jgi:hypothetical protein
MIRIWSFVWMLAWVLSLTHLAFGRVEVVSSEAGQSAVDPIQRFASQGWSTLILFVVVAYFINRRRARWNWGKWWLISLGICMVPWGATLLYVGDYVRLGQLVGGSLFQGLIAAGSAYRFRPGEVATKAEEAETPFY